MLLVKLHHSHKIILIMIGRVSTQNTHYNAKPVAPPSDFYISTMNNTNLTYLTNISSITFSSIDIQPYSSLQIVNSNEILRYDNDLHIFGNYGTSSYTLKLKDCKLIKNRLFFQGVEEKSINTHINYVLGTCLYNGYLYLSSNQSTTIPLKIARINKDNLNDITTLTLGLNGVSNNIIVYDGYVYVFNTRGSGATFPGSLIKASLDLATYSVLFTTGTISTDKRVVRDSSFTIYNNEIYIPIINNSISGYNHQGLEVYNMSGSLQRATYSVPINSAADYVPCAYCMSVYNNKLIIVNSQRGPGTSSHISLVRMNTTTLAVEESIKLNMSPTDDHSIFSDGYIYLNGVYSVIQPVAKLIKVKYNDFTDLTYITPPTWGDGSYGSINPLI
jgi:hypothetical protein